MDTTSREVDVLVAGGGPTGLMLAASLTAAGVTCRVVDQASARPDTSRALVVHARSLELLAKLGVADQLVARGRRGVRARVYVNRRATFAAEFGVAAGVDDTPYPFVLFISQVETERALDAHLGRLGVSVERPVTLVGFDGEGDGVRARLRHGDGREETVYARYVVGCDGAHSAVRKAAAIPFEGAPYPQDFVLADLQVAGLEDDGAFFLFVAPEGLLAVLPLGAPGEYRLIASRAGDVAPDAGAPTVHEFQALAARVCPVPLAFSAPVWLARFRLHHRLAAHYRAGRAFLAGDAAHIHSPAGGQGMNTGLQDAANLAWKLALVIRDGAPEALLDSYESERRPVGRRLLRTTDRLFALAAARHPVAIALAGALLPHIGPRALGDARLRRRAFRFVSQLDIAYPRSSAVGEAPRGGGPGFRGGAAAGHRAPDAPVLLPGEGGATTLFALLRGPAHHLLVFAGPGAATLPPGAQAVAAVAAMYPGWIEARCVAGAAGAAAGAYVDHTALAHERYGLRGPGYYLVRPDGYVAFRAPSLDADPLATYLGRLVPAGERRGQRATARPASSW